MTPDDDLEAAVAAGVLGSDEAPRALLQSIVEAARGVFGAKAASVMRYDAPASELVFEAVAGEGAGRLVGMRIPSRTGIAGWVLASEEPIALEDVQHDPRFARDVAERTGFVPTALTAFPLLHEERALGVFNVLDRDATAPIGLADMEALARFAHQAAIALALAEAMRRTTALLEQGRGDAAGIARLAAALDRLEGPRRAAALRLVDALEELLRPE